MYGGRHTVAWSWAQLPLDRVVRLAGTDRGSLAAALDPLPDEAPAVMIYRPDTATSPPAAISGLLDELESAASSLYPSWLPGAEAVDGTARADLAAVRALARKHATGSDDFGPFLADLAERCQRARHDRARQVGPDPGRRRPTGSGTRISTSSGSGSGSGSGTGTGTGTGRRFAAETRAVGLARVVATTYLRAATALLVDVPPDLPHPAGRALLAACEWFAHHGRSGVWLTGAPLDGDDRVSSVPVPPVRPASHTSAAGQELVQVLEHDTHDTSEDERPPRMTLPAPAGRPHPGSQAEQALEKALAAHPWAAGRAWNQSYSLGALNPTVRLDLVWFTERCVVEVDGPEHWGKAHYAEDRHRDVSLQLDGFAVLRFTNDQVFSDVDAVAGRIERCIHARRASRQEGHHHV